MAADLGNFGATLDQYPIAIKTDCFDVFELSRAEI